MNVEKIETCEMDFSFYIIKWGAKPSRCDKTFPPFTMIMFV